MNRPYRFWRTNQLPKFFRYITPQTKPPRNHHDVIQAKQLFELLKPHNMELIHITHSVLEWALANQDFFNEHFYLAHDGDCVLLTQ